MITLLIEKFPYNLGLGGHMTLALGSSGTMSMAMSSYLYTCICDQIKGIIAKGHMAKVYNNLSVRPTTDS